jgi:hypothetical protein
MFLPYYRQSESFLDLLAGPLLWHLV